MIPSITRHRFLRAASALPGGLPWQLAPHLMRLNNPALADTERFLSGLFGKYFPEAGAEACQQWARQHVNLLAYETMDTIAMSRVGTNDGVKVHLHGFSDLEAVMKSGAGVILVLNHYDRILSGAIALARRGMVINSLTMEIDENAGLSTHEKQFLHRKIATLDSILRGVSVGRHQSLKRLYTSLEQGGGWCILADAWDPGARSKRLLPFLDRHIELANGIERIAARTGARLVHLASYTTAPAVVDVRLTPLPENPSVAVERVIAMLNDDVKRYPWAWLNWGHIDALCPPVG